MELKGKWACPGWYDTQLNITEDGRVSCEYADIGEFGVTPEFTIDGDKIKFSAFGIEFDLKRDGDKLIGKCAHEGKTDYVEFILVPAEPEIKSCHHFMPGDTVEVPAGYPLKLSELVGLYQSNSPWNVQVNISDVDGKMELLLSFDKKSKTVPVAVWFEGNDLVYMINDAANRGVCRMHPENGMFVGEYTQIYHGKFSPVECKKVSDTPKELKEFVPAIPYPDGKSREELLRECAEYNTGENHVETEFTLYEKLPESIEKYGFSSYIEGKSGDDVAFACLDFMADHFRHGNTAGVPNYRKRTLADFLEFEEKHDCETNCRGLSIMLAEILRSQGIKAQHVTCMPYEEPFEDCHVVVDCILPSGKRVMFDPTYHLYFTDEKGEYVSIERLRHILLNEEKLTPNEGAVYTGNKSELDMGFYRWYMSKNTVRFEKGRTNSDGNDEWERMILFSKNYPWEKLDNLDDCTILTDEKAFW